VQRLGLYTGGAWAVAASLLLAWGLAQASVSRRRAMWPVVVPGAVYLALVAATFAAWRSDGFLVAGARERRLWLAEAAALILVTLGQAWETLRLRRARAAVAQLVIELARSAPASSLRDVLANVVGDPDLGLAFALDGGARLVNAQGDRVDPSPHHARTLLVRDGTPVAVLTHRPGALDDAGLVEEVATAARLGLDNERLRAELGVQLADLRASRARIVAAGDAERLRLERDLHDGAQQRVAGLALSLRLFRSELGADVDPVLASGLDDAANELAEAIRELRELAHGIFPAVLADEGLAAAVEAFAEEAQVPLTIGRLPGERLPAVVENAAYAIVAFAGGSSTTPVVVHAGFTNGSLVVEVETGPNVIVPVEIEDRVRALNGRLAVEQNRAGRAVIRAELPCGL
jgi:signal transduction histidine kinase